MVKIVDKNKVVPKKKPIASWAYTTKEGGTIQKFRFPESDSAYQRMKRELENVHHWRKYPGPHPEGGSGSRNYTIVTLIPGLNIVKVHSLFFPDGKVWDSTMRDFRKIRDYEQQNNKHE